MTPTRLTDEVGNVIHVGDIVRVTALDADRGAHAYLTDKDLRVTRIGRTRAMVYHPNLVRPVSVGNELLRVVAGFDGRTLRTWENVR